jgi:exonuclease SbcC
MIPHKLQLKNFLSYGAQLQTVDFSGHRLICLSGKNGHGKSALLDAITWAIWGQARKAGGATKADSHLLRLGSSHMLVAFEFFFNNTLYKIRREFSKQAHKALAQLDFAIFDTEANTFKPLTDKTIRDTQELIIHTLGLSFEEFINSAFLRQGQSNEFSKRSAQERKEILSGILGLHQYEEIRRKITETSREQSATLSALEQEYAHLQAQTSMHPALAAQMSALLDTIITTQTKLDSAEKRAQEIEQALHHLQKKQAQYEQLSTEKEKGSTALPHATAAFFKQVKEWRVKRASLAQRTLASTQARRQQLHEAIAALQAKHSDKLALKEQSLTLRAQLQTYCTNQEANVRQEIAHADILYSQIKTQEQVIQAQHQHLYTSLLELSEKEKNSEAALMQLQPQLSLLEADLKQQPLIVAQFEKRKSYFHKWASRAQQMHKELEHIHQKLEMTQGTTNPCCPLCEQNLSASRKKYLRAKLLDHENPLKHQLMRLKKAGAHLKELLIAQHAIVQRLQKKGEEKTALEQTRQTHTLELASLRSKKTLLQEELEVLNKAFVDTQTLLSDAEKHSATLQSRLTTICKDDLFVQKTEQQLQHIENELTAYATISDNLTTLQNELIQLSTTGEESNATLQKEVHAQLLTLRHTLAELQKEKRRLKTIHSELEQLAHLPSAFQTILKEQATVKNEIRELQHQLTQYATERGALEQQIVHIQKTEQLVAQKKKHIEDLKQVLEDKQILAHAFGKDGIQALLIEEALPEIEHEANALLQQLTDNQTHIIIDSLRDLKKGGVRETLDIKISDTLGIRPYELFSGGEAFRIDFALRIALAKLLANRSGTSLQTLIIDEGFGSQDEEGLGHIMDALYRIQDHFSKIIIVSHLPAMKDQFPVHFMIEKTAQGSNIRILEQG